MHFAVMHASHQSFFAEQSNDTCLEIADNSRNGIIYFLLDDNMQYTVITHLR